MTKAAFLNSITLMNAIGGVRSSSRALDDGPTDQTRPIYQSTNVVLHLLAVARAAEVDLSIDDFQAVADRTPLVGNMSPSGKYNMPDLHRVGGTPAVLKYLLENDMIDGSSVQPASSSNQYIPLFAPQFSDSIFSSSCLTVTGKTVAENLAHVPSLDFSAQDVIYPLSRAVKPTGHLTILRGNIAPGGAVAKITGKEGTRFEGTAMVFEEEWSVLDAIGRGEIKDGTVVVIAYRGPKGAPGMPEMLTPTAAIVGAGLTKTTALITDGRFVRLRLIFSLPSRWSSCSPRTSFRCSPARPRASQSGSAQPVHSDPNGTLADSLSL